jgi:hypothetical protein
MKDDGISQAGWEVKVGGGNAEIVEPRQTGDEKTVKRGKNA